jgi:anti-sigma regulatory factor (Ser/Thr protein kinase)
VEGTAEALDRVDEVARGAMTRLLASSGVRRVGVALSEGAGRRLRFTASDRDHRESVDWCHIDAYDDVPLTTVLRTGESLVSDLDHLEDRYAGFAGHQRAEGMAAVAVLPLTGSLPPPGAVIVYYDTAQTFDAAQLSELEEAAAGLAQDLRSAQVVAPRDVRRLAAEPVPTGSLVADLLVEGDPRAVGSARRWARRNLEEWGLGDDLVDTAALCLSELVTNAVIHTRAACEVRLLLEAEVLTVTVRDQGLVQHSLDGREAPRDPLQVHGRGLQLVDALSSNWGSGADAGGTTVWFRLQ